MSDQVDALSSGEHEEYLAQLGDVTVVAVAEAAFSVCNSVKDRDPDRGAELLTLSADLGHPVACLALGVVLQDRDPARAENYLRRAADVGLSEAAYQLGLLLCDRDIQEGLHYLQLAERAGHPEAANAIKRLEA